MAQFDEIIREKSIEELKEYIDNFDRYSPWALTAVIDKLKERGYNFSEEELKSLYERIEKKKEIEEEDSFFGSSKSLKKYVVTDPNAPLLYSKIAISAFSLFFTVIFGAILLAKNIDSRTNKIKVIGIGILFTSLAIVLGNLVSHSTLYLLAINGFGGYVLSVEFWNKYIGRETKYRVKPIWLALTISIAISVLLLMAMIYG